MKKLLPFVVLLSASAWGQEKAVPPGSIVTDRPDFTESAIVVPRRWLQLESGLTYQSGRGLTAVSGPEMLLRYGVANRTELRFGLPDYNVIRAGADTTRGWGDFYAGAKFQVGPLAGDDVAIIAGASVPSDGLFSSGSIDPEAALCWSRDLEGPWAVAAMAFGAWPDEGRATYLATISFAREMTERSGMFLEYAGAFSETDEHVAHAGFTYFPSRDSMLDVHFGLTLSGESTSFIAAGWSIRF